MTQREIIAKYGGPTAFARRVGITVRHAFRIQSGQTQLKEKLMLMLDLREAQRAPT